MTKNSNTHPRSDDEVVDSFAAAMKEQLALARAKGLGGWQQSDPATLSRMLREHLEKGDPCQVANFCMFLWYIGQPISPGAAALAHGWKLVPVEPTLDMLKVIGNPNRGDWERGKDAEERLGPSFYRLPPIYDYELAWGQYERLLDAVPPAPAAQSAVAQGWKRVPVEPSLGMLMVLANPNDGDWERGKDAKSRLGLSLDRLPPNYEYERSWGHYERLLEAVPVIRKAEVVMSDSTPGGGPG
jgi:hypothetical protein